MNHIPRLFDYRSKQMNSKKRRPQKPKLERQLAKKNIAYDHSTSESESPSSSIRSKSLDLPPKSFRIQGMEGEFEAICSSLGLTGPDDFGIPVEAWEARKARSQSDLLPRSRLRQEEREEPEVDLSDRFKDSIRISEPAELNDSPHKYTTTTSASARRSGEDDIDATMNQFTGVDPIVYNIVSESLCGRKGGIKGVRPPLLAPPSSIALPDTDNTSSTWDDSRSFPPENDKSPSIVTVSNSDEEEDEGFVRRELRRRGAAIPSESCSFTTTSNDDDSSSTTTEPMSNISPNGRFIRNILYWEKGELLGRGSFGSVYECIADGGFFMAVKEVSLLDQGDMGRQSIYQLEQEIALLSQFEHENIVQYYGTDKDEAHLYIFLELVTKGSLRSLYQRYHLRDSQVSSYTRQILHGLKHLHERNVIHRDIKCANILVHSDGSVKLADFGLAKATKLNDVKSCKGTAFWMAPEVVRGKNQGYGLPADIWSLGCTVLEMLTHQIPYSPLECISALFRIGKGEPPPIPHSLSRDAQDFISRCLKVDPNDRPTATQLLDHPFVRRPLPTSSGLSSPYHFVGRGLSLG